MAARLAAFDWSKTPVGPMEKWPQSLRLALGVVMGSRFPMVVWWGPQVVNFYNDAYVPFIGDKHPTAFGRSARQTLAEIWDVLGPQVEQVMVRGEATWSECVRLVMNRHGYDEETWFTWSFSPILDDAGGIGGMFCACYEETAKVHAERSMRESEHRLEQALEAEQHARGAAESASRMKDEFLATLSHELRTPLNAILGWSHMLRREGATPQEVARGADVIERNARAQARIIEDLLDMSAIISGKVRLEMVAMIDVAAIVLAAVDSARPTAEAKRIALETHFDTSAFHGRGDPHRLQQVFWNLLNNAIKFTPAGGRIEVRVALSNGSIAVSVRDTGEGIPPEFLPHVFDRFRQADASITRRHGGLGLGLAIVKQLVELHGGFVRAESEGMGHGARFTVELPANPESAVPEIHGVDIRPDDCEKIAGTRVLVVDDDPDARELVRRILEGCNVRVATADSGAMALELIRREHFDVLVSDIGMPGEDGHALMRRIRALPAGKGGDIPAVALTAYARPEDRVNAIRAGYVMHAAKPLEPAELIAMVASLTRRPQERE